MKKRYLNLKKAALILGIAGIGATSFAQQRLIGTVRTRSEYRDGLGVLPTVGTDPALFTSQRTNLLYGYKWTKLDFQVQLRDVRVWGQDASTISNNDGSKLFVHEAWGEFTIATAADTNCKLKIDNMALKIGRQELVYDDVRLLGNLDWLQQGRRHDAAVLKMMHKGYQVDLGAAYNQNTDGFGVRGVYYNPQNATSTPATGGPFTVSAAPSSPPGTNAIGQMYKSMQYLYSARKWGQTKISILVFKDDFAKFSAATAAGVTTRTYTTDRQTTSRWTMGSNFSTQLGNASGFGKIKIDGGAFVQRGNKFNSNLEAYMANLSVMYTKGKFQVGPAVDYLSGNTSNKANDKTDNAFDPLYGTPHKWWGYMDYFYTGTPYSAATGLISPQIRAKYTANRYFITLDYHNFMSEGNIKDAKGELVSKNLGNEIDLIFNYNVNKFVNMELGYSKMFGSKSLAIAKGQNPDAVRFDADWAYAMITIRPDFFFTPPVTISAGTMNNAELSTKVKELQEMIESLKQKVDPTPAETTPEETTPPTETK